VGWGGEWGGGGATESPRVEGIGLRVGAMPRRRWLRLGRADETRRMGAWVFMAPKCCAAPFPALNPNPSRSFLSAGRGDYPKGFGESESVTRAFIQGKDQQANQGLPENIRMAFPYNITPSQCFNTVKSASLANNIARQSLLCILKRTSR